MSRDKTWVSVDKILRNVHLVKNKLFSIIVSKKEKTKLFSIVNYDMYGTRNWMTYVYDDLI